MKKELAIWFGLVTSIALKLWRGEYMDAILTIALTVIAWMLIDED